MDNTNKSDGKAIEWLRDQVDKLKGLLDDPQPGLMTWAMFYSERMQNLYDFWSNGYDSETNAPRKTLK